MNAKRSLPPSVKPGIPRLERFPASWRRVPFGEVLQPAFRPIKLQSTQEYQLVVARRNRGGIEPRERLRGDQVKTPTQFELKAGDFVVAKRQIIHGGCGFVPASLDGAIVSGEYDVFRPRAPLLASFLRWFAHTTYFQQTCYQSSIGVDVEKMIFQTDRWLRVLMPLPPASAQRRIARVLDAASDSESRLESLVRAKGRLKQALLQQLLTGKLRFPEFRGHRVDRVELREVAELVTDRVSPASVPASTRCVELEHMSSGDGRLLGWTTATHVASLKTAFRAGDVLFGKLRPYLRKFAAPGFGGLCSTEIWDLRPIERRCESAYLLQLVQSSDVVRAACTTSGTKMPRADWSVVGATPVWMPAPPEQARIAQLLSLLDNELTLLDRQLAALRKLKRGLMQKLLTGELEVPDADEANNEGAKHAWTAT